MAAVGITSITFRLRKSVGYIERTACLQRNTSSSRTSLRSTLSEIFLKDAFENRWTRWWSLYFAIDRCSGLSWVQFRDNVCVVMPVTTGCQCMGQRQLIPFLRRSSSAWKMLFTRGKLIGQMICQCYTCQTPRKNRAGVLYVIIGWLSGSMCGNYGGTGDRKWGSVRSGGDWDKALNQLVRKQLVFWARGNPERSL